MNTLIDPNLGWTLTHAMAINDLGQIVGYGVNAEGVTQAFLLTPDSHVIPEPSSVALMALGLAGLAGVARRRGRSAR